MDGVKSVMLPSCFDLVFDCKVLLSMASWIIIHE